jgi:hypothetical protein
MIAVALGAIAASKADWPAKPRTPGYVAPWNRVTEDTVLDLAPGERANRLEFRGTLLGNDHKALAHLLLYVYHADIHGFYGTTATPEIPSMAGCVRSGPHGGFIVRTTVPGSYGGPPHIHLEASLPGRGRCVNAVNLRPDSATGSLPGFIPSSGRPQWATYYPFTAVVHLDRDGIYRAERQLDTATWGDAPELDSLNKAHALIYERAPWRQANPESHR